MKTFACVVECRNTAYEQSLIVNAHSEEDAKRQIRDYQGFETVFKTPLKELKFLETGHLGIYPVGTHATSGDSLED